MKHRRARSRLVVWLIAGVATASWTLVTACSSSTASSPADGGTGDAQAPAEDAGAPDVLGDTINAHCDPVKQDCADPALRCQIISLGGEYVTGCQPPWDPAVNKEGEICSYRKTGYDDCVKGLHCMPDGVTATACRRFCQRDSDCGAGSKCGAITTVAPYFGACWKPCAPFSADCPGGTCSSPHTGIDQSNTFEACREIGAGGLGTSCKAQWDCAADLNCQGRNGFQCKPMCDDAHPCGDGGTCTTYPGLANNGGACE
jgi:hypothetical protein